MLICHLDFSLSSLPISSMNFDQIIKNLVLAKQSTISITETNFIMLFSEVNTVSFWESYKSHKFTVWLNYRLL